MYGLVFVGLASGLIGIFMSVFFYYYILKQPMGTEKMIEVWKAIREGASAYMRRQIKTIITFSIIISVVVAGSVYVGYKAKLLTVYPELHREVAIESIMVGLSVIAGSIASLIAAFFSMDASTKANVRTTAGAMKSSYHALRMTMIGGSVLGFSVPSLSLFFISLLYLVYYKAIGGSLDNPLSLRIVLDSLAGFAFGASLSALFAQLGGGIYTKSADIGADLVGKVEASIPEDDPRNPAVIADQVGDNVGDCAGRGADIFESVTAETLGAMMIGWAMYFFLTRNGVPLHEAVKFIFLPLAVASIRIIAAIPGIAWGISQKKFSDPFHPMRNSVIVASATGIVLLYIVFKYVVPQVWYNLFIAAVTGIVAGALMVIITNWYTGLNAKPVVEIAENSKSGVALTILSGLSVGMSATLLPIIVISIAILVSFISGMYMNLPHPGGAAIGGLHVSSFIYGVYGTAMATMGMLSLAVIIMTLDGAGPIADNAGGIAEMSGLEKTIRDRLDPLDALGNVTKAMTKGYAIGSAALAALLLFQAFVQDYVARDPRVITKIASDFTISLHGFLSSLGSFMASLLMVRPEIVVATLIGAMVPFYFTARALRAVTKAAYNMVEEVRRQFRERPGILEGKEKPDYYRAVDISTKFALKNMLAPSLVVIVTPLVIGLFFGGPAVGALVIGATAGAITLGITMMWGGGAWDNAKKYVEAGNLGGKGSPVHAATVVGDTVGDPLKDTAGPSLHIVIKLLNTISLVFIPLYMLWLLHPLFP